MKRNRYILFVIILVCVPLSAQTVDIAGRHIGDGKIDYRVKLLFDEVGPVLNEIDNNQYISLQYTIRLYKKNKGFLSIFGDTVLASATTKYILSKDFVSGQYIITHNDELTYYTDNIDFLSDAFQWYGTLSINENDKNKDSLYLKGRCIINYNILEPPMKIVELLLTDKKVRLQWVTFSLDETQRISTP